MRQQEVVLKFEVMPGKNKDIKAKIADLYVREGAEYLLTDCGQEFPLDNLISIK